jgi:flavin reductase ActVB
MTSPVRGARPSPVNSDLFCEAMSLLVAPLTVVTTRDSAGRWWGFTASSVTSVSLDPPLLLLGLSRTSSCRMALIESPEFVVNVLGAQHRGLARQFARPGVDRFSGWDFDTWPGSGLPYLADAHAVFRCTRMDLIPVGDHELVIGELTGLLTGHRTKPLLWYRRQFHCAQDDPQLDTSPAG